MRQFSNIECISCLGHILCHYKHAAAIFFGRQNICIDIDDSFFFWLNGVLCKGNSRSEELSYWWHQSVSGGSNFHDSIVCRIRSYCRLHIMPLRMAIIFMRHNCRIQNKGTPVSYAEKMIIRNAELKDGFLNANRAVRGIAPQVGAGEGSTSPAIHDW